MLGWLEWDNGHVGFRDRMRGNFGREIATWAVIIVSVAARGLAVLKPRCLNWGLGHEPTSVPSTKILAVVNAVSKRPSWRQRQRNLSQKKAMATTTFSY